MYKWSASQHEGPGIQSGRGQPHAALLILGSFVLAFTGFAEGAKSKGPSIDFNTQIRPILTENCFKCHGPDDGARKAKLRLDIRNEALKPAKDGKLAIVAGSPEKSELISRVTTADEDDRMPPIKTGKNLSPAQIESLRRWIAQGAPYATHWSYVKPVRPQLPEVKNKRWIRNAIDHFILARLEREGLKPSPEADRYSLIRRVSLDLTGLPPTMQEVNAFVKDPDPKAYEKLVDRLLMKQSFGEHWARMWLDLARYADSAGYADDPPRTIWKYRDYVIKAFNANKPFDRLTLEQIAGDLLDDSDEETLIGTAFHRNTMTNNEGGTSNEEFRNAAVVDRVNTTMAVWMGTSMACAQCHNHKYDPISQQEYFRFFAFFNNTADDDLTDESPVLQLFTPEQKAHRAKWQDEIAKIEARFKTSTPELVKSQEEWERNFTGDEKWARLEPGPLKAKSGGTIETTETQSIKFSPQSKTETYTVDFSLPASRIAGLRLEVGRIGKPAPEEESHADFSISRVAASLNVPTTNHPIARYLRLDLPGKERILSLAEVQVFSAETNIALHGEAKQSSIAFDGVAARAIDGNTDGSYDKASTTHTGISEDPWWELDLKTSQPIDRITIWNRTDGGLQSRMKGLRMALLDEKRNPIWERTVTEAPNPKATFALNGSEPMDFVTAYANDGQGESEPKSVIEGPGKAKKGWVLSLEDDKPRRLTLLLSQPMVVQGGSTLQLTISQITKHDHCPPALLRVSASDYERISEYASVPESIFAILSRSDRERTADQEASLSEYYRSNLAPEFKPQRDEVSNLKKRIAEQTPNTTVPIMRELAGEKRRKTHIQFRGNYLALGDEVAEAVPAAFNPLPKNAKPNRLTLAKWLVDKDNPLTARVMANRFWEQIFGIGIVRTSEDFGSQGDRPTHPELLDWLACEFRDDWDIKAFLKLLVTSATYRQSSRVTPQLQERDPDNLLLARGPRVRMPAEVVRDQALAVSGLLSTKMYGPSVRPPRPSLGLSAAFGSSLDWKTSEGEDRYRRALYVEWRRTSPYPSMATFDAPNREVCTIRRPRSNTPLQALVTLNDPVYVEAAQALGRRMNEGVGSTAEKLRYGFRLCLARPPEEIELKRLVKFYETAKADYTKKPEQAKKLAGLDDSKKAPSGDPIELAAWTAVGNVLLNLDETLMRP